MFKASIYTIAVGAAGSDGQPAPFDERCSAKLASNFVHNPFSANLCVVSFIINEAYIETALSTLH